MSEPTHTTQLSLLLTRLGEHLAGDGDAPRPAPTPDEAMAMYRTAAQLVELQLRARTPDADLNVTREVLLGTRQVLCAALDEAERPPWRRTGRPALLVIDGGGEAR